MTLTVLLSALALSLLCGLAFSIPLPDDNSTTAFGMSPELLPVTQDLASAINAVYPLLLTPPQIIDQTTTAEDLSSFYLFPPNSPLAATAPSPSATSISLVATTTTEILTDTDIITEPPTTITVSVTPSTVTDVVTIFIPTSPPPPSSTPTKPAPSGAKAAWAAPAQMTDLSAFNISAFPSGQQNLRLVNGIPADASASAPQFPLIQPTATPHSSYTAWDNASTAMQLLYPADSVNPAAKPQGGAEFYATPLDIAPADSVTMGYSVFFPDDFDWVKAGKLPGLFGGRMACSGGDAALDCFSTRLMWRPRGEGELYLYAPKDKQTDALCAAQGSVCDAAYGFSIGRGSFTWFAGGWTTVSQTVKLNTPGKQDGVFWLYVNGKQVIYRDDIFYRDVALSSTKPSASPTTTTTSAPDDDGSAPDDDGGGLLPLGPLLGSLLNRRTVVQGGPTDARPFLLPVPTAALPHPGVVASATEGLLLASNGEWVVQLAPLQVSSATSTAALAVETTTTSTLLSTVPVYPTLVPGSEEAAPRSGPIGFIGIFFSTFFGGHGAPYATPRDQYVWFKDFDLIFNR
ncbi:hypothetical protein C8R44DRAFT_878495 [Mycena epipterygia]|nr:hypothetical protein C8R44DRAFT_878495 [Mycena epipterygia]